MTSLKDNFPFHFLRFLSTSWEWRGFFTWSPTLSRVSGTPWTTTTRLWTSKPSSISARYWEFLSMDISIYELLIWIISFGLLLALSSLTFPHGYTMCDLAAEKCLVSTLCQGSLSQVLTWLISPVCWPVSGQTQLSWPPTAKPGPVIFLTDARLPPTPLEDVLLLSVIILTQRSGLDRRPHSPHLRLNILQLWWPRPEISGQRFPWGGIIFCCKPRQHVPALHTLGNLHI